MAFTLTMVFCSGAVQAQLTGIKSVGTGGDYATIATAIADLNGQGVGTGGVTFNVAAGHTETAANIVLAIPISQPTAANPVVFQKSGSGANPLITAAAGVSTSLDGIIKLSGADYITFDGIDLLDPPSNTGNAMMEWGYALLRASTTDGCQNVVIKNCVITLQKINASSSSIFSIGIYLANRDLVGATVNWTDSLSGSNSRNKFFGNTISNVYKGIVVVSSSTARDFDNEVGVVGAAPNAITNWGGSSFAADGIRAEGQINMKINNNIVNGGTGTNEFVNGIIATLFGASATAPNYEIAYNTVTVSGAHTSRLMYAIRALATGDTVRVHHNTVENCTYPTATSAPFHGIALESTGSSRAGFVHDNIVRNNSLPGTGLMSLMTATGAYTKLNVHANEVYGNQKTGASGSLYGIQTGEADVDCYFNLVYNNAIPNSSGTSAASVYGYLNTNSSVVAQNIYNNTFSNLSVGGTSSSSSSVVYGIYPVPGLSTNSSAKMIHGNTVYGLSSAVGTVAGIFQQYGATSHIYGNHIYNVSTAATDTSRYAAGIIVAGSLGTAGTTIYNNFISDVRASASNNRNGVIGINATVSSAGTSVSAFYNSIFLNATSAGANFGSSGISSVGSATATTATLDLRNNIVVNTSVPNGTGLTVALRRTNTNLTNYSSNSNNNCLHAGTPSVTNLIFYDGTNSDQTITSYQARVTPRDVASFSIMPPFVNSTTTPYNLHIQTAVASQIESGGTLVGGITTDVDGDLRFGAPGYGGTGTAPDVGADELEGTPLAPMVYESSTVAQISGAVFANTINNPVLRIEVVTTGFSDPLLVTQFNLNTNGSTNAIGDISVAKVFYTGASATFGTGVQFGSFASPPPAPATYTIAGSQALVNGTNYFWLAYDLPISATGGNVVDGEVPSITVDANQRTPSVTAPSGSRPIVGSLSGTYTLSASQPYPFNSFSSVAALLGSAGVTGPVVFNVGPGPGAESSGPYIEQVEFTAITGASVTNTVTINGNGETVSFAPTSSNRHVLKLNGTRWLTVNNLNIVGTDTDYGWGIHLINGADNNTITNCTIDLSAVTSTSSSNSAGIVASASATSVTSAGNNANYCLFTGNTVQGGTGGGPWQGIRLNGNTGGFQGVGNRIVNNVIRDFYAEGLTLSNLDSAVVSGNNINRATRGTVTIFQGVTILNGSRNSRIEKNRIHTTNAPGANPSATAYGIYFNSVDAPTGNENVAVNNMLYNFNSTSGIVRGIYNLGSDGAHCFFNSILIDHPGATGGETRGFYQTTSASNVEFRNNIISITRGGTGTKHCLYFGTAGSAITSNHNLLYMNAPAGTNHVGFLTSNYTTLVDWQATGHDANSVTGDPLFVGPTDLHISSASSPASNAGTPIVIVADDFDGDPRNPATPDIGADEFVGGTPVTEQSDMPTAFALSQNYPNPFNPTTNIQYALPVESRVQVAVYNLLGQRVRTLVSAEQSAGYHGVEWDGRSDAGSQLSSGVYFLRLAAEGKNGVKFTDVRKLMMVK